MIGGIEELSAAAETTGVGSASILAVVQGLTEFLPVSSSGHLVLTREALNLSELSLLLDVAVHVGTLGAVVMVYRSHLGSLLGDVLRGRFREVGWILLGSIPAGIVGLTLKDFFEEIFTEGRNAAYGLLLTSLLLLIADGVRRKRAGSATPSDSEEGGESSGRKQLNGADALLIGAAQAVAIWPGVSRSGSTISVGLMRGLAPSVAARFSFMLSIVVIGGAAVLTARDAAQEGLGTLTPGVIALAMLLAWGVGWIALKLLLAVLERGAFRWFAAYTAALAIGYLLFL